MNFSHLRIATKLWIFITLVITAIAAVAVVGLVRSGRILAEGRTSANAAAQQIKLATRWTQLSEANILRSQALALSSDGLMQAAFKRDLSATASEVAELEKMIEALPLNDMGKEKLQQIAALRSQAQMNGPGMAAYVEAQKAFVAMLEQHMAEGLAQTEQRRVANSIVLVSSLTGIVILIFFGTAWLVRSIRDPLAQANAYAERIAGGDLSASIQTAREDEFGQLLRSLGRMNESLGRMVSQVRHSTDSIATASVEIATGNNDLAQRTEQTSSNLQSTASSMDELTSAVQQSACNAREASSLAASASSVAEKGGAVVHQVVSTMGEINSSSQRIADIIGTIDGIAFQTNILALNAAVEAARAGEQGRGFAVVASEVRSLAQRSGEAAKEIKELIGASVERVEFGSRLVADAGATMNEIVQSVRKVADVIGEITATSAEQSAGISQVNKSVTRLDEMTQQNAALVEESAAAAESLREQSQQLAQAVAVFKIDESGL